MRLPLFGNVFRLLGKGSAKASTKADSNSLYNALVGGLDEMERQYVDRIPLVFYETDPSPNVVGRPIPEGYLHYYPTGMLTDRELRMIGRKRSYTVIALVGKNVGNSVEYKDRGVEVSQRTYMSRQFLSLLKPEPALAWITENGVHTGDAIKVFARLAADNADSDLTPEIIKQAVETGIKEYNGITMRLMEKGGVYRALEQMRERQYTPFEQIMADMRNNIASVASARN